MKTINTSGDKLVESAKAAGEELRQLDPGVARGGKQACAFHLPPPSVRPITPTNQT